MKLDNWVFLYVDVNEVLFGVKYLEISDTRWLATSATSEQIENTLENWITLWSVIANRASTMFNRSDHSKCWSNMTDAKHLKNDNVLFHKEYILLLWLLAFLLLLWYSHHSQAKKSLFKCFLRKHYICHKHIVIKIVPQPLFSVLLIEHEKMWCAKRYFKIGEVIENLNYHYNYNMFLAEINNL